MTTDGRPRSEAAGLIALAVYAAGAWAALTVLYYASAWRPVETIWQSGQVMALIVAGLVLLMCVTGAITRLLAFAGASVPDRALKP